MKRQTLSTTTHFHTYSTEEAWQKVNELFPTDYDHDPERSRRAGYPIYHSTADGVSAWISDLGTRLEVNLPDVQTVNVWIEEGEEEELPENMDERRELAKRIQRLAFYYTEEYLNELHHKEEEEKAIKEIESNPSAGVRCLVLTADQNAKVMLDCMRDCVRAVKVLVDKTDDVDAWMVAGCNAAISKASEDRIIPFDLPASLCGMLGADYRKSTKEEE